LKGQRQQRIVEELATQLDELYQEALRHGSTPDQAECAAQEHVSDWNELSKQIADAERPNQVSASSTQKHVDESSRHASWLRDSASDCPLAVRSLARSPFFAVIAVLTLALGLSATTSMLSVIYGVLVEPLPYEAPDRLVKIWEYRPHLEYGAVSYPNFIDWQRRTEVFESLAAYRRWSMNLTGIDDPAEITVVPVSAELFEVLGTSPLLGRRLRPEDDLEGAPLVALLTFGLWQSRFGGDSDVVGRTITLDGLSTEVIGIMPKSFQFPAASDRTQVIVPLESFAAIRYRGFTTNRDARIGLAVVGRIKPGFSLDQARSEMDATAAWLESEYPGANAEVGIGLEPLHEWVTSEARGPLFILLGSVAGLMLVACANVANLFLARLTRKREELAIRSALGARANRIVRMLLTESLILWLTGGLAGIAAAWAMNRVLVAKLGSSLPRAAQCGIDFRVALASLVIATLTGLLFGLISALGAARLRPAEAVKGGCRTVVGSRRRKLRSGFVAVQAALAFLLLVSAGLTARTVWNISNANPGIDPENVLEVEINLPRSTYADTPIRDNFYHGLLSRIESMPGVRSAATTWMLPFQRRGWQPMFHVEGQPPAEPGGAPMAEGTSVSPGYFKTMAIPLIAGRDFDQSDGQEAPGVIIVDQAIAQRYWPGQDPLGKRMKLGQHDSDHPWLEVVGVVGNVKLRGVQNEARSQIYRPRAQSDGLRYHFVVKAESNPSALVEPIRQAVLELDPNQPLSAHSPMQEYVDATTAEVRLIASLLTLFATVALLLAAVGFYGVMAGVIAERTREVAVRIALGAQTSQVQKMMLVDGLRPVIAGTAAGLILTVLLSRVTASFLFEVSPLDPVTYLGATLFLFHVALTAGGLPSRRLNAVDPINTLRSD
jgi:putative ABC transport system permease protein